jgi:signal peptidase I
MKGYLDLLVVPSEEGRDDVKTYFISLFCALLVRFTIVELGSSESLGILRSGVGDQLAVEKVTKRLELSIVMKWWSSIHLKRSRYYLKMYGGTSKGKALIKRVVAVEGDQVSQGRKALYQRRGKDEEDFIAELQNISLDLWVVPAGNVLVLGDNRNHSLDGHGVPSKGEHHGEPYSSGHRGDSETTECSNSTLLFHFKKLTGLLCTPSTIEG